MTIISAIEIEKTINTLASSIDILKGVNLNINAGESVAIVGASGSGKTTLLSLLAGLDTATKGALIVDGQPLAMLNEDQRTNWRLGRIGFVFQQYELLAALTALENVMLPLEIAGVKEAQFQATQILEKVGLKHRLNHFPSQLSGGEQQRVAIARAYVILPKVLFADEPTGCLDEKSGQDIIDLLFSLQVQFKTTLVFVTHDAQLASRCDRVMILDHGKIHEKQDASCC